MTNRLCLVGVCLAVVGSAFAQAPLRDYTCFQGGESWDPKLDIATDMAVIYGADVSFPQRAATWRDQGYNIALMTGIAWGEYSEYYGTGESFKKDEVQTRKDGSLFLHGPDVGYNVPTLPYIEFMKKRIEPAVDAGATAIFLEEPEYWASTGWSPAFKKEWEAFYHEPWQEPDSSPDAQYRASRLKYELYFRALDGVFGHADARAKEQGREIDCIVPTHSLVSYSQWSLVSPMSHLIDLPQLDGYIAQVWTGTARSANRYAGVKKERTLETGYFEYGQMMSMVRPTGRKVWFLADPVEDNPNRSWNDYKLNYECTIVASLFWPDVARYEVMPWPSRIFNGTYPKVDMDKASGEREGIPAEYATQILTVINALNEMEQKEVTRDMGTQGVGVVMSDTLMFQRADGLRSDADLGQFFGLAMPLLKAGVPVEPVQLENTIHTGTLEPYKVLLLTYEGQKPLKPEYHDALAKWVSNGGGLIVVDDGSDPFNGVREWWNDNAKNDAKPYQDLLKRVGATDEASKQPQKVGKGFIRYVADKPSDYTRSPEGAEKVRSLVKEMLAAQGGEWKEQNYVKLQRGPFVVATVLDESVSDKPLEFSGTFVDLFNPMLPVVKTVTLQPATRDLLYDLSWPAKQGIKAKVVAAGSRIRNEKLDGNVFTFNARGPVGTNARARVLLPKEPTKVASDPALDVQQAWDAGSSTLLLTFPNVAKEVKFEVGLL
ncbi:MAG: hypothetical protein RBU21_06180 [FCB group bacterium]|nr:hypothetical protein [FCB group bacterium]